MTAKLISAILAFSVLPTLPCVAAAIPQTSASAVQPRKASRVDVDIKGMYCESCEKTVHAMLMRTAGIKGATINAKTGHAVVIYDSSRTKPAAILQIINRLGYSAKVSPSKRSAAARSS